MDSEYNVHVMDTKTCSVCKVLLPLASFARHRKWLRPECRSCKNAKNRAFCALNREKIRTYIRTRYANGLDRYPERNSARYYSKHEKNKARIKEYSRTHPHVHRAAWSKRYAKIKGSQVEPVSYDEILTRDGHHCYLCDKSVLPADVSFDHVIPVVKGGPHRKENIKVAHLLCNQKKGSKVLGGVS